MLLDFEYITSTNSIATFSLDSQLLMANEVISDIDLVSDEVATIKLKLNYIINGEIVASDYIDYNSTLTNLRSFEIADYKFVGWYLNEDCTVAIDSTTKLTTETTIYGLYSNITWQDVLLSIVSSWYFIVACCVIGGVIVIIVIKKIRG